MRPAGGVLFCIATPDPLSCAEDTQLNVIRNPTAVPAIALQNLIERIGAEHVERRLKVETEHGTQLFGQGLIFFNLENWYSAPWILEAH